MPDPEAILDAKRFVFNAPRGQFEAGFRLDDVEVVVTVAPNAQNNVFPEQLFQRAFRWLFEQWEQILDYCAQELLSTKNDAWLKDGEAPWDAARFKRMLRLKQVHMDGDGGLALTFLSGGLFWGHWIVVEAGPDLVLSYATLAG